MKFDLTLSMGHDTNSRRIFPDVEAESGSEAYGKVVMKYLDWLDYPETTAEIYERKGIRYLPYYKFSLPHGGERAFGDKGGR